MGRGGVGGRCGARSRSPFGLGARRGAGRRSSLGLGARRGAWRRRSAASRAPAPPRAHHAAARRARRARACAPRSAHLPRSQEDPRARPRLRLLRRTRLAAARRLPSSRRAVRRRTPRRLVALLPGPLPEEQSGRATAPRPTPPRLVRERDLLGGERGAVPDARRRRARVRRRVPLLARGLPPLLVVAPRRVRARRRRGGRARPGARHAVRRVRARLRPRARRARASPPASRRLRSTRRRLAAQPRRLALPVRPTGRFAAGLGRVRLRGVGSVRVSHPERVLLRGARRLPGRRGRTRLDSRSPRPARSVVLQAHVERVHGQLRGRRVARRLRQLVLRRARAAPRTLGADQQDRGVLRAQGRRLHVRAFGARPLTLPAERGGRGEARGAGRGGARRGARRGGAGRGAAPARAGSAAPAGVRGRRALQAAALRQEVVALGRQRDSPR